MPIKSRKVRVQNSGFRVQGVARWRFAFLGLFLGFGLAQAGEQPRVITLAPHLTELVFAAGAGERLVGVVDFSDYPAAAADLPSIGDAFRFDLERIMLLAPDSALAWRGGTSPHAAAGLSNLGVEIVWIETSTLAQIGASLTIIGERLGTGEQARQARNRFERELEDLRSLHRDRGGSPRTVFYQVSARPLYTLGGRHVINEILAVCGLVNLFGGLDTEAGVVDEEAIIAAQPAFIIAGQEPGQPDPLARWRQSKLLNHQAVRLLAVDANLLVRPTPRILEGIDSLCRLTESD